MKYFIFAILSSTVLFYGCSSYQETPLEVNDELEVVAPNVPDDMNTDIYIKNITQWVEMCNRQPDSPACICAVDPDKPICQ